MSAIIRLCIAVVLCVSITSAEDLQVGSLVNTTLVYSEEVKLSSIPLTTREKNVFYNTNNSSKIIKAISAVDLNKSKARVSITSGGIDALYVNVRLKSSRGDGLNYLVQIFV
ncbi:unnamed protein product [Arctia plantaginis]|uniref:Auto-transporter adhesin head GIN domain-containing protein n=1 Tax=Arctia plantaginis TaxID=874455 RepID=A0A8S1A8J9_ARCPL|nr:unnamed protein product [Arctia plantaginis]